MATDSIDGTYGVALVGFTFAVFLYGCVCVQTCRYHILPSEDPRWLRWTIKILWVIESSQISFTATTVYHFLILRRMDVHFGASPLWTIGTSMIVTHISDFLVRSIFIHRVWLLTKHHYALVGSLGMLALLATGFGIACGILLMNVAPAVILQTVTWPVYTPLALSAATDVAISSVMSGLFVRYGKKAETAQPLLHKLMIYTASAGVLPSAIASASLLTYIIFPQTYLSIALFFILPQATLNTMLAMLNARSSLRNVLPSKSKKINQLEVSVTDTLPRAGLSPQPLARRNTISYRATTSRSEHPRT